MRQFTEEEIKALNIVKGIFSEKNSYKAWPNHCPKSEGNQSVGETLDYSRTLIDEVIKLDAKAKEAARLSDEALFLGPDYKAAVRELRPLFKAFADRMRELGYRLVLDGEYMPTILPKSVEFVSQSYAADTAIGAVDAIRVIDSKELLDMTDDLYPLNDIWVVAGTEKAIARLPEEE
jgi:hypothetical protein